MKSSWRLLAATILTLALLGLLACGDDDPSAPEPEPEFEPELSELWPNEDGTVWNFSMRGVERELPEYPEYGSPEELPPIPSFEDLYKALHGSQGEGTARTGTMKVEFDGVHGSRPDVQQLRITPTGGVELPIPFRNGEASWKLESDRVAGYPEYGSSPSWIYLTSEPDRGDDFIVTIYEGLEHDITLEGRVWRHLQMPFDGRTINCVEVVYLVDQGVLAIALTNSTESGYFRAYTYGVVVYGQGVGPMAWREKSVDPPLVFQDLGSSYPAKSIDAMMTLESVDSATPGGESNSR